MQEQSQDDLLWSVSAAFRPYATSAEPGKESWKGILGVEYGVSSYGKGRTWVKKA